MMRLCLLFVLLLLQLRMPCMAQRFVNVRVQNAVNTQPLPYATIALLRNDSTVQLSVADQRGNALLRVPQGVQRLRISNINFATIDTLIPAGADTVQVLIALQAAPGTLSGVEVTAKRETLSALPGGYLFTPDKTLLSLHRNTTELLKQLPGIQQGNDGGLKLMGSNMAIWIDGKPLSLSGAELNTFLRTLKTDDVKSIRVYTTPPAIYDASSGTVIEIITNRNIKNGLEAAVEADVSTRDKYYAGINLKYNNKAYSGALRASYDHTTLRSRESQEQYNYLLPDSLYHYNSYAYTNRYISNTLNLSLNNDFALSPKSALGVTLRYNAYDHPDALLVSNLQVSDPAGLLASQQLFLRNNHSNTKVGFAGISYRTPLSPKTSLTSDLSTWKRKSITGFDESTTVTTKLNNGDSQDLRRNNTDAHMNIYMASLNISHDLGGGAKLRVGGKFTAIDNQNSFDEQAATGTAPYIPDPNQTYDLAYKEQVGALFASVNGTRKKWSYTAGLRWEATHTGISTARMDSATRNNNDYNNLFPSVSVNYKAWKTGSIGLGYSRSIIRIQYPQLNPLNMRRSAVNSYEGNPYLQPILQDALNLDANKSFGKQVLTFMARYSISHHPFLPILFADSAHPGQFVERYTTYKNNTSLYLNLQYRYSPLDWLSLTASARAFETWTHLDGLYGYPDPAARLTLGGSLGVVFSFWKNAAIEIKGDAQQPQTLAQGRGYGYAYADFSFSKSFLHDALSLSCSISDLLNTREDRTHSYYPGFSVYTYNKGETRIATLSIAYKWGKPRKNKISTYFIQDDKRFSN